MNTKTNLESEIAPVQDQGDDWLDELVTTEAKRDPDWKAKAKSGLGAINDGGKALRLLKSTGRSAS